MTKGKRMTEPNDDELNNLRSILVCGADTDEWMDEAIRWGVDEIERLRAERDTYRDLAKELYQPGTCSFDHHGGCQEHLWLDLGPGEECPDGRAQRLFAKDGDNGS